MLILMAIRIYTRHKMSQRGLGIDDILMVLAAVFSTALVVIVCICAIYGTGYHNWDIRPEWYPTWGRATFSQNLAFVPAATLTKVYHFDSLDFMHLLTTIDIHTIHLSISLSLASEQDLLLHNDGILMGMGHHPNHRYIPAVPAPPFLLGYQSEEAMHPD
jgi:hypothetical protein